MNNDDGSSYGNRKWDIPSGDLKLRNRYGFTSEELQDMIQNKYSPVYSVILDLTIAAPISIPQLVNIPGRAVVIYGINVTGGGANAPYDPVANTGIEPIASTAFVFARFNSQTSQSDNGICLKHNRGLIGTFPFVYLTWPAQSNVKARLVVYNWDGQPWNAGEAAT